MSTILLHPPTLPLRDDGGVLRIGATRVTLDSVVGTFHLGATAEEIVLSFPTLQLSEVYAVLSYYLKHRTELDAYLADREKRSAEWEALGRANPSVQGIRERLLARQQSGD